MHWSLIIGNVATSSPSNLQLVVSMLAPVIPSIIAAFVALYVFRNSERQKRVERGNAFRNALNVEIDEASKHFERCLDRLRYVSGEVMSGKKWPDQVFIEKLAWPEGSLIFSADVAEFLEPGLLYRLLRLRQRLRNYNYDVNAVVRVHARNKKSELEYALAYLQGSCERLKRYFPMALDLTKGTDILKDPQYPDILMFPRSD